jgi:predicted ABC-type exoprotein transport system permease subunit
MEILGGKFLQLFKSQVYYSHVHDLAVATMVFIIVMPNLHSKKNPGQFPAGIYVFNLVN